MLGACCGTLSSSEVSMVTAKNTSCNCCSMLELPLQMVMVIQWQGSIYVGVGNQECVKSGKLGNVMSLVRIRFITAIHIH